MEALIEFGKIIIPAGLVLYAMYLIVKSFINSELDKKRIEVRGKSIETVLPNRLHAFERVILFLERISPNNLIVRLNNGSYTAREFQQILLNEIREEYNHNVSQQLYMSEEVWDLVKSAKEDLIVTINDAVSNMPAEATGVDLSKMIFERTIQKEPDPIQHALLSVKREIWETF
ncbi:MAG: hypothetical protein RIB54_01710 [Fulvivirga sp.]|jgi:predicted AlkP superfamily phosphohydrolase/phosphomutase|uniref:DUF7935 family protein n=1 Tax=Fulvivirga sp. TaxID=1931237 RepID=UPI0032EF2376